MSPCVIKHNTESSSSTNQKWLNYLTFTSHAIYLCSCLNMPCLLNIHVPPLLAHRLIFVWWITKGWWIMDGPACLLPVLGLPGCVCLVSKVSMLSACGRWLQRSQFTIYSGFLHFYTVSIESVWHIETGTYCTGGSFKRPVLNVIIN